MSKQWALSSVAKTLGYDSVSYSDCHDNFIKWVSSKYKSPISVVDIGGGNGRVLIKLRNYVNRYVCLDINAESMDAGRAYFDDPNFEFINFDVDSSDYSKVSNGRFDVCYIDSVLTMVDRPFDLILDFLKFCDIVFVNRTRFTDRTSKDSYKWGGMQEDSVLWAFDESSMLDFCQKNGFALDKNDQNSFIVKWK